MYNYNLLTKAPTLSFSRVRETHRTHSSSRTPVVSAARFEYPSTPSRTSTEQARPKPSAQSQIRENCPTGPHGVDHSAPFKARGFSVLRESSTAIGLIKHVRSHGRIVYAIDLTFSLNENSTTILAEGAYCLAFEDEMRFITRTFPYGTPVQDIENYFAREYDPNAHVPLA
ncbi:hypothetical protein G3O06_01890 [Burkholderia sp. Ac-20345]|uniref:hypothetical protein n=1 Tax=Burkholderia sp. Ac-20345 TaxID=2703891 RepID=UPI00197B34A3|nr:hypothetical protein [Burkholderia sp. Ac-20345]MBN3776314.1 hypothetical protein [Burkholderia sp. Ac-20345]